MRQAIDLLASEGLVRSIQGKGTFVERVPGEARWLKLATTWDSLISPIRENVQLLNRTLFGDRDYAVVGFTPAT